MAENQIDSIDFKVDRQNFYREESFTDLKAGSIRRLTPVKSDGTADKTRKTIFIGYTNLLSPQGQLPIQAVIKARDLQQAIKHFPEAMKETMENLIEEAKKQKQEESRIIVPGR